MTETPWGPKPRPPATYRRSEFLRLSAVSGAALFGGGLLAGCGPGDSEEPSAAPATAKDEPGNLKVFTYRSLEAKELWTAYAKQYPGKPPSFQFLDSDAQAFSKVRAGLKVDITQASAGHTQDFKDAGLIQPWTPDQIASWSELDPELMAYGQVDGKQWNIPTDFGFHAPLYRADLVEPEEDSWGLIFDKRYKGKITWYDAPSDFLMATGLYLGVDEPLNMSDSELADAKKFLIEKKKLVRNMTTSPTDVAGDLQQGNIVVAMGLSYVYTELAGKGIDVVYMQPKEGRISWTDGFMLMKGSENPRHAHDYVSAWLSKESGTYENGTVGLISPNSTVGYDAFKPNVVKGLGLDQKGPFVPPKAHILGYVARRDVYGKTWDEIKAA